MASMHLAARDFALTRANALTLGDWRPLWEKAKPRANEVEAGLWGYDSSLGAAAVMTFFYPNRQASGMALVCVALCVLLDGAMKAIAAPLGMPVGTGPFCLAAIAMMLTHGGVPDFEPVPIADVSTAEDHLYSFGDEDVERARLLL